MAPQKKQPCKNRVASKKKIPLSKLHQLPNELIGTVPSSGRVLPNQKHRCSPSLQIDADSATRKLYDYLGFVVTQDGKPNRNIQFDIKQERHGLPDPIFY